MIVFVASFIQHEYTREGWDDYVGKTQPRMTTSDVVIVKIMLKAKSMREMLTDQKKWTSIRSDYWLVDKPITCSVDWWRGNFGGPINRNLPLFGWQWRINCKTFSASCRYEEFLRSGAGERKLREIDVALIKTVRAQRRQQHNSYVNSSAIKSHCLCIIEPSHASRQFSCKYG